MAEPELIPMWLLLSAAIAFLIPWGVALIAAGGQDAMAARRTMLTPLAAYVLAVLGYATVGFALHFGGVGLLIDHPDLSHLVWEWSALSERWGATWGMAGMAGFFLQGAATRTGYLLFLSAMPWASTAALIPIIALRGRTHAAVAAFMGALTAAVVYPLFGNWIQVGGWLTNLGLNLGMGRGYLDFGGATLFLFGGAVGLATMLAFIRRTPVADSAPDAPPAYSSLAAVLGAGLIVVGSTGWLISWPLIDWSQFDAVTIVGNAALAAAGGAAISLLTAALFGGGPEPLMGARGVAAGWVAALAGAPYFAPGVALLIGAVAGLAMVLVTAFVKRGLRLQDPAGVTAMLGIPAWCGLLAVGQFTTWPGQLRAQLVGSAVVILLAILLVSFVAVPLSWVAQMFNKRAAAAPHEETGGEGIDFVMREAGDGGDTPVAEQGVS